MDRFPKLVLHTWLAMQCINHEDAFQKYYCSSYVFPRIHDGAIPQWIQQSANLSPRWRIPNKTNILKFGSSRHPLDKSNSPFFSLYAAGKTQEYNWRYRPKINMTDDPSVDVDPDAINRTEVEDLSYPSVVLNGDIDISMVDEIPDNDQENVEPVSYDEPSAANGVADESTILDGSGAKNTRHRHRHKHRHKKKPGGTCEGTVPQNMLIKS